MHIEGRWLEGPEKVSLKIWMGTYKGFTLKFGAGKGKKEIKQAKHRELIFD